MTKVHKESKEWDKYWDKKKNTRIIYDVIASFYRNYIINRSLAYFIKKYIKKDAVVLHAGCGGGEVDKVIKNYIKITALDFSPKALKKYIAVNGNKSKVVLGDVRSMPLKEKSFDAVYNLGVFEHFTHPDIQLILKESRRILKEKGTIIVFWPPEFGISVVFFKTLVWISKNILRISNAKFHPLEVSRIRSKQQARKIFEQAGLRILEIYFGPKDLYTYMVIVAEK